jgi:hypothetical protein
MGSARTLAKEIVRTKKVIGQLYVNKAHLVSMVSSPPHAPRTNEPSSSNWVACSAHVEMHRRCVNMCHCSCIRSPHVLLPRVHSPLRVASQNAMKVGVPTYACFCFGLQNAQLTEQLGMVKVAGTLSKSTEVMKIINDLIKVPVLMQTMQSMAKEMMKAGIIDEVRSRPDFHTLFWLLMIVNNLFGRRPCLNASLCKFLILLYAARQHFGPSRPSNSTLLGLLGLGR